jgi:hypothetical protein
LQLQQVDRYFFVRRSVKTFLSVIGAVAIALGLAACGNSSTHSTQEAATRPGWASAADSICESYQRRVAEAFGEVEKGGSASHRALAEVAKAVRASAVISTEMTTELRGLERPPTQEKNIEQFLTQLETAPRLDSSLADDLEHREIQKAESEFKALEQHALKARVAARQIGVKDCEQSSDERSDSSSLF